MKKMLSLILALVLVVSLTPAVSAGKNPDTGAKVEPKESWGEYSGYHRYVPLGQKITIKLDYDMGNKGWVIPTWKLYKTNLTGKESPEELAKTGESLVRNKKSAIDSYGGWVYNFPVWITVDETFDADELGVGTYLMVGYVAYENQKTGAVTIDYKTLCAIAIHVVEKEKPIESVRYYLCKEDGTTIRELSVGEELTVFLSNTGNDLEPSYIRVVPSPVGATEFVMGLHSPKSDNGRPTDCWEIAENFFGIEGERCGNTVLNLFVKDYADGSEYEEVENIFTVTVPHAQDGPVKTLIRPTCTETGLRGAWCESHVLGCDYVFEKKVLAPYGHGLKERGKEIVTEPTATKPGVAVGICATCGVSGVEQPIPAIFSDVAPDAFYSDALDHGYDAGWVSGLTATTFGPNASCNRAQVVTFLWRAAGCPMPTDAENPFEDVAEGDYYYNAVLWAVEKGITAGVDATHFAPKQSCSRAQVVAFLHRAMGSPEISDVDCPFTDVETGEWYELPVLWAVENGITAGLTPDTFGVNTVCNRAQVVTFLYRTYHK